MAKAAGSSNQMKIHQIKFLVVNEHKTLGPNVMKPLASLNDCWTLIRFTYPLSFFFPVSPIFAYFFADNLNNDAILFAFLIIDLLISAFRDPFETKKIIYFLKFPLLFLNMWLTFAYLFDYEGSTACSYSLVYNKWKKKLFLLIFVLQTLNRYG